jgi:hypothetical protein
LSGFRIHFGWVSDNSVGGFISGNVDSLDIVNIIQNVLI